MLLLNTPRDHLKPIADALDEPIARMLPEGRSIPKRLQVLIRVLASYPENDKAKFHKGYDFVMKLTDLQSSVYFTIASLAMKYDGDILEELEQSVKNGTSQEDMYLTHCKMMADAYGLKSKFCWTY